MGQENKKQSDQGKFTNKILENTWVRTIIAAVSVGTVTIIMLTCCMFYTTGSFRLTWKRFISNVVKSTSLNVARSESKVMGYLEYSRNRVEGSPIVQVFNMMVPLHTYIVHADDVDFEEYVQMAKAAINNNVDEKVRLAQADYDDFLYYNGEIYGTSYGSGEKEAMQEAVPVMEEVPEESNLISQEVYMEDEGTVVDAAAVGTTMKPLSIADLTTYESLIKQCYTVDRTTIASESLFKAQEFAKKDFSLEIDPEQPQILLYHTHSQETFYDSKPGVVSDTIVGVGDVLADILREEYGVNVIHDRSTYDMVDGRMMRDGAYTRALPSLEQTLAQHPSIEVMIDLHRDGMPAGLDPDKGKRVVNIDGEDCAQIMLFNGLSANANGEIQDLPNVNLKDNLAFSFQLFIDGKSMYPKLMKPIYLKPYRFNLHFKPRSTLVEMGTQYNTVEEAKSSMKYLAEILMDVLNKPKDSSLK